MKMDSAETILRKCFAEKRHLGVHLEGLLEDHMGQVMPTD